MTQAQSIPASAGSNPAKVIDLSDANLDPLLKLVLTQLDDDQAQDIVTIDLKGKSSIADHMVIASAARPARSLPSRKSWPRKSSRPVSVR